MKESTAVGGGHMTGRSAQRNLSMNAKPAVLLYLAAQPSLQALNPRVAHSIVCCALQQAPEVMAGQRPMCSLNGVPLSQDGDVAATAA